MEKLMSSAYMMHMHRARGSFTFLLDNAYAQVETRIMPRTRKTRTYTCTDEEYEQMKSRLPYQVKGKEINSLSQLFVYSISRLPKR